MALEPKGTLVRLSSVNVTSEFAPGNAIKTREVKDGCVDRYVTFGHAR